MSLRDRNRVDQKQREERANRKPDYQAISGEVQASVWEEQGALKPYYVIKLSRKYLNNKGLPQYADSIQEEHIEDAMKVLMLVNKDIQEEMRAYNDRLQHPEAGTVLDSTSKNPY